MGEFADMERDRSFMAMLDHDQDCYDESEMYEKTLKTCKHCGKTGLHWDKFNGQWRLHDGGSVHKCF